ncbi:putative cold-induced protein, partial [Operophtera brumata]
MKPLFSIVVTILVLAAKAHPENIEEVKELPQSNEPVVEAEESEPAARIERCTTCTGAKLNLKSHKDVLAALTQLPPGAEVHTQQSFEGCSSDKGCAGLKVKDGQVFERFGNLDAFRQAAAQDTANEFTFHPAGTLGNNLAGGEGGPFWWMNQNSPFKNAGAGGNFEKFSKSSSSSFSTTGNGANGGGANFDIAGNPFLNGDFSKISGGFTSGGAGFTGAGASGAEQKPSTYQSSSFESSSFSTSNKDQLDLSKNPFLAGGQFGQGQSGFGQQGQNFNGQAFGSSSTNKFSSSGSGYTGSSPSPFSASTPGSNINQIQNTQKASEFDFTQQQQTQQNIDEAFQHTGNVNAHEHSGGELQQTCAGQGYVCVNKAQCNNGVVNSNGGNLLQANT